MEKIENSLRFWYNTEKSKKRKKKSKKKTKSKPVDLGRKQ